jgi:hypothetical protein
VAWLLDEATPAIERTKLPVERICKACCYLRMQMPA